METATVIKTGKGMEMANYYCKYCGYRTSDVRTLTLYNCPRHPNGSWKGKHALYEGDEKAVYTCKYCGKTFSSILTLSLWNCPRHPNGVWKGKHSPAL